MNCFAYQRHSLETIHAAPGPLSSAVIRRRHWESLHGLWAATISTELNDHLLPPDYFAEMQVKLGMRVEVDIATLTTENGTPVDSGLGGTATAVQTKVWAPTAPAAVMPAVFPDDMEVLVFSRGISLAGAIELVSPGNKDCEETRQAFVAKCAAYLQRGIGVIVVDLVTSRHANLHDEARVVPGPCQWLQL